MGVCRRRKEAIAELSEEEWERKIGEKEQKQERKMMATIHSNHTWQPFKATIHSNYL